MRISDWSSDVCSSDLPLKYPAVIGMEGMGVVEAVGADVSAFKPGDRVAYADMPPGAYAAARVLPWHRLVKLPDATDDRTAAIGGASWRERACQYVEILVVAGSIKKK